jgi:hypothetical protein
MEPEVQAQATQVSDSVGSTSTGLDPNIQEGGAEQLEDGGKPLQEDIQPNDSVAKEGEEHLQNKSDDLDWGLVFTFFKFRDE